MIYPQVQDGVLFLKYPGGKVPMEDLTAEQVNLAISWMVDNIDDPVYWESGPDCNTTRLAEDCCNALNLWAEDQVPEDLFEIAFAVDQEYGDD